jgi:ParB family chromosome partitioning protein
MSTGKGRFGIDTQFLAGEGGDESVDTSQAERSDRRLGPMATAIREAKQATAASSVSDEDADLMAMTLAVEMKRLRDANLDLRMVALEDIDEDHLTRDRADVDPEALEELKTSIKHHGLSQPVRVDLLEDGRLGLNQGRRRLRVFRELLSETGDERYARIPAMVDNVGERLLAYQRMVDENLIREDVSMAELARLAIAYAEDESMKTDEAVDALFASANRKRRWIIKEFIAVMSALGDRLQHPKGISHNLARRIVRKLSEESGRSTLIEALDKAPERSAVEELTILEAACKEPKGPAMGRVEKGAPSRKFRIKPSRGARPFDVSVSDKRLIVSGKDIGRLSDDEIRDAIEALVARLPFP